MHRFVSLNNEILPADKSTISAVSSAALYGKGVFTTLAVYNSKPFLWEKHWQRLKKSAERLKIDLSDFSEESLKDALSRIVTRNNFETGRARLTLFDESSSRLWNFVTENKTNLLLTTAPPRKTKAEMQLTVSPFPVNSKSPLAGIKSCNYLENLLVLADAQRRGFDEAIRLNENGEVVSASMANIFWVKDEKIFTPALETGCLGGTIREFLIENFTVRPVRSRLEKVVSADEIFLSSSAIGLCRAKFGETRNTVFRMTTELQKFLDLKKSLSPNSR